MVDHNGDFPWDRIRKKITKKNKSKWLWWILGTTSWRKWYLVTILINVRLQEVINPRKLVEKNPLTRVKSPTLLNIVTKYHFHYHVLSHTPICILSNKCGHSSRTTGLRFLIQMIKPKERRILPFLNRHCHLCQISWRALACLLDPRAEGWSGKKKKTEGAQRKTKRPVVRGFVVFGVTFVGSQIWKNMRWVLFVGSKVEDFFVERQKEPNPTTEKTYKKNGKGNRTHWIYSWSMEMNGWYLLNRPEMTKESNREFIPLFSVFSTRLNLFLKCILRGGTLPETHIKTKNPRKEVSIPTIHFQVRAVNFREGKRSLKHHHCPLIRPAISSEVAFQVLWLLISRFGVFRIPILPVCDYFEICLRGDSASSLLKTITPLKTHHSCKTCHVFWPPKRD